MLAIDRFLTATADARDEERGASRAPAAPNHQRFDKLLAPQKHHGPDGTAWTRSRDLRKNSFIVDMYLAEMLKLVWRRRPRPKGPREIGKAR
jgi:hypothetical protein